MANAQELIGTKELADLLKVDTSTVVRRVYRGELVPCKKLPGKRGAYLFDRATIDELAADKVGAA